MAKLVQKHRLPGRKRLRAVRLDDLLLLDANAGKTIKKTPSVLGVLVGYLLNMTLLNQAVRYAQSLEPK